MNFQQYAQKGEEFVKKVATEIGCTHDPARAGKVLRSTLHVLRDQSSPEESMQFISQLPMMIKAIYVDGWSIGRKGKRVRYLADFVARVREENEISCKDDLSTDEEALAAIKSVFRVLKAQVSKGEIEDLRRTLPEDLRSLLD